MTPSVDPEHRPPPLVGAVWALLVVNVLGSQGAETFVAVPQPVYQLVTMGSLLAAFVLALALNPRIRLRPNAFLLMLSLLLVTSLVATVQLETGVGGGLFRCWRLAMFLATLWLLTCWWDGSVAFVRYHIRAYAAVLATVVLGLAVAPGLAMPEAYGGRLTGAVWPLTPPQVGQYAAVVAGLTLVLWLARRTDHRSTLAIAVPAIVLVFMSYTRTATLGLVVALVVAGISLALTTSRARRFIAGTAAVTALGSVAFASAVEVWFRRGQTEENFANLTGRQKVWDALLAAPRTPSELWFGVGLGNKSFDGLPIDSGWLAVYQEQGLVGVGLVAVFLATLLAVAFLRPPSPTRACAVFLIVYCLIASYTEVGLGDASPYLLHLAVAASLLVATTKTGEVMTPLVPGPTSAQPADLPTAPQGNVTQPRHKYVPEQDHSFPNATNTRKSGEAGQP
ncbi:MAG TPA: O-antigen ligase family protein [Actinophytocola sp.]|nr:O-antigen ligase family protein [Actinophytocola sp.]